MVCKCSWKRFRLDRYIKNKSKKKGDKMKESNFKLTQTIYDVVKLMDDKTAGKFFKCVCNYAFHGEEYDGNDLTLKSNFLLVKRMKKCPTTLNICFSSIRRI